jgi:N utilization substance protein B
MTGGDSPAPRPRSLGEVFDRLNAAGVPKLTPDERRARTVARLAAVQGLYQMELSGAGVDTVVREFLDHRFESDLEGEPLAQGDHAYFEQILQGVVADQQAIDSAVVKRLAKGWRLERLDATVRAMLRAGTYELIHQPETPFEVVIDEYVELAKAFFDESEAKFVNAALDGVARDVRS